MGRLYRNDGAFGEVPIGRFDSKYVEGTSVSYQNERIFCKHLVNDYKIAECRNGIIYNADGNTALARLNNGIVYDTNDREIARYEGDVYGAAAAVVALILRINAENYNEFKNEKSDVAEVNKSSGTSASSGGSQPSDTPNIFEIIIGLIGAVITFVVKAVKFVVTLIINPKVMIGAIIGSWVLDIILRIMHCITEGGAFNSILGCFICSIFFAIGLFTAIKLNKSKKEETLKKRTVSFLTLIASPSWIVYFLNSVCYLYGRIAAMIQGVDYYSGEYEFPFFIKAFFVLQGKFANYDSELFPPSLSFLREITYFIGYRFKLMPRVNFLYHYISDDMFFALVFSILVLVILANCKRKHQKQQ